MVDFGKYAVIDPVTYNFQDEPDFWWKIKPITSADEMDLQRWRLQRNKANNPITWIEGAIREISLCAHSTNLPGAGLEDGGSVSQFEELIKQMPPSMLGEIWVAVGEANPLWGPPRPPSQQQTSPEEQEELVSS